MKNLARALVGNVLANEYDLGGHAGHAKDLLRQANWAIKQAAMVSNEHGR